MKKFELVFSGILVPVDFLMIILATLVAYFLRFESFRQIRPVIYEIPFREYLNIVLPVSLVCLVIFAMAGLYSMKGTRRLIEELVKIFLACSTAVMIVIVLIFFKRELFSSRFIIVMAWFLSLIFVSIGRLILHYIQHFLFKKGFGRHRVVIIGEGKTAQNIIKEFEVWPTLGYEVKEQFRNFKEESRGRLKELVNKKEVDEVFLLNNPQVDSEETLALRDFCEEYHLIFNYSTDFFGSEITNFEINTIAGVPVVEVKRTSLEGWGKILKRIFDLIGSFILIILTLPLMIVTAIAVKLDSRGPIFFSRLDDGSLAKRIGQYGEPFRHFKFRSMKPGTHSWRYEKLADLNFRKDGPMVKIKDDPRLTRVGRIIRKLSIDELPELFLVFMGKMSLVGPRPHLPEEVARYEKHHKKVLTIKPGLTGLAQISGRSDLEFEEEVRLDTYYIEHWSIWLDLLIIFRTPWIILSRKSAY